MQNINTQVLVQQQTVGALSDTKNLDQLRNETNKKDLKTSVTAEEFLESLKDGGDDTGFLVSHMSRMSNLGFVDKSRALKEKTPEGASQEEIGKEDQVEIKEDFVRLNSKSSERSSRTKVLIQLSSDVMKGLSPNQQEAATKYLNAYYSYLISEDPRQSGRMRRMESELKAQGMTEMQMFAIQKDAKSAARQVILQGFKNAMQSRDMWVDKKEYYFGQNSLKDMIQFVVGNRIKMGGIDRFTKSDVELENAAEIRDFLKEAVEQEAIGKSVRGAKDSKALESLVEKSLKAGVDIETWINSIWQKKKDDLGLIPVYLPGNEDGMAVDLNLSDFGGDRRRGDKERAFDAEDPEKLMSGMRAVFLRRLLKGDMFTSISSVFEVRKWRNGLIKLGLYDRSLEDKISFEAEVLARKKTMEMISEALLERSTLMKSKGAGFDANDRKIKSLRALAERLGIKLDDDDISRMQEKSDLSVLSLVERQISEVSKALEKRTNIKGEKVLRKLEAIRSRLVKDKDYLQEQEPKIEGKGVGENDNLI